LNHLCNQTYENWEAFVVIDIPEGGDDGGASISREYECRSSGRIHTIVRNKKTSCADARNTAFSLSHGSPVYRTSYFCLLDPDDYWGKYKLKTQIAFMQADPIVMFSWMNSQLFVVENGKKRAVSQLDAKNPNQICSASSWIFTKELLCRVNKKYGYIFDPSLSRSDDMDLYYRILAMGYKPNMNGVSGDDIQVYQEIRNDGLTNESWWKWLMCHEKIAIKNGLYWDFIKNMFVCPGKIIIDKIKRL
jgi:glycosyltransferase involved in cell wall biosynthesis